MSEPLIFSSGMSRRADFEAALAADHHIGIDIQEMSANAMRGLAEWIVASRAQVFVDSGAFAAFRAGLRKGLDAKVDFPELFDRYEALQRAVCVADGGGDEAASRLHFVMPDVVGDQQATLAALRARDSDGFVGADDYAMSAIFPLQAGELTLVQFYDAVCAAVGVLGGLRVGIPSAEAAASDAELYDLLRTRDVYAVHILGAAGNKRARARLEAIELAGFDGEVSMDANRVRSYWNSHTPSRKEALGRLLAGLPPKKRADIHAI